MGNYTFDQTLQDITVHIPLAQPTRAKMLDVKISPKNIYASTRSGDTLIEGEIYADINTEESTWGITDQTELSITLEKKKQEWWPHVVTTDPKIDVTKIEPEQSSLSDLDSETRATVEKMMHDQQQKQLGRPTSDEQKQKQMLDKFKNQHPELDFSQLQDKNIKFGK